MFSRSIARARFSSKFEMPIGSTQEYVLPQVKKQDTSGLPPTQQSAFRKRPVRLNYDSNEFHMFRLPSENKFLLGSLEAEDIFGKRKGIQHSPHIKAQTQLDTRLLWIFGLITVYMAMAEIPKTHEYKVMRENFRDGQMGKFKVSDFK